MSDEPRPPFQLISGERSSRVGNQRSPVEIESDMDDIRRLANGIWLLGKLADISDEHWTHMGSSIQQMAREIERYTKRYVDS
jgi:hypothetical protein